MGHQDDHTEQARFDGALEAGQARFARVIASARTPSVIAGFEALLAMAAAVDEAMSS